MSKNRKPHYVYETELWQHGFRHVAGIDEAGRGALAGPIVAAAVVVEPFYEIPYPVNDSKVLSVTKRNQAVFKIIKHCLGFGIGVVAPEVIDQQGITYANQQAFQLAIQNLSNPPDFLLIDGYQLQDNDWIPQRQIIKGDRVSATIASASILAKVYRDWLMEEIYHPNYRQYGFNKHKGYGTKLHREQIVKHGTTQIHRKTYLNKLPDLSS